MLSKKKRNGRSTSPKTKMKTTARRKQVRKKAGLKAPRAEKSQPLKVETAEMKNDQLFGFPRE